jgi:8-amino-7-oxononanoate synthase
VKEFDEELNAIKKKGLLRTLSPVGSFKRAKIFVNGKIFINFSSNDYLGLSRHPSVIKATITALKKYGLGTGSSRLLSGSCCSHHNLEQKIADFKRTERALVFNSGYAANTGIIPALADADYTIFSDEFNHASLIDGIRLSKARKKIFLHRDTNHLEKLLKQSSGKKLIITETIFSMDGDIAPLPDIVFLSKKHGALLMIDDAHGSGVLGKTGRGGLEHFAISGDNVIQMGTLSKALGCFGGFAAGSRGLIELLINKSRSFIYSTSLPPAVSEACVTAIDIVQSQSRILRKRLWEKREKLSKGLLSLGFDTLDSETPIIPLFMGDVKKCLKMGRYLYRKNIFAPAIRPPTVPNKKCRIRFSVTAVHTDRDIDFVLKNLRPADIKYGMNKT